MSQYTVPVSTLTHIAFHLLQVIDADLHRDFPVVKAKEMIESGTVFKEFIRKCWIDQDYPIWRISESNEAELLEEWRFIARQGNESVLMSVETNGVCLLIGYLLDGLQRRAVI